MADDSRCQFAASDSSYFLPRQVSDLPPSFPALRPLGHDPAFMLQLVHCRAEGYFASTLRAIFGGPGLRGYGSRLSRRQKLGTARASNSLEMQ
jgi:hypothetical protein